MLIALAVSVIGGCRASYGQFATPGYPSYQPPAAQSQAPPDATYESDPAEDRQHGVARISIVQGDVNVRRGDTGELVAAVMNAPLMGQDHLQTAPGSRAEVELDSANLVRLAPNTDVGMAQLAYRQFQLQLAAGTMIYRVLRPSDATAEIDTPSIAVRPTAPGEYRISVLDDGTTQITVRSGQAEIYSPHGSQRLGMGSTTLVRGNPSDPEFQQAYEIPRDQLDDWSETRDRELLSSDSYGRVSRDIDGAEDLDRYGSWVPSQYGQVWQPQAQGPDWSPYSNGEWSWEPYYGWTWVDSAPWGWAPYHYGRWFWNTGHGWCWWPGALAASYRWSPALVGFFGWGGGAFGFGGLGWVALAPFETFHVWWGHGFHGYSPYGRGDLGILRNANIANMYRNAAIRGGAMTAAYNAFGGPGQRFAMATRGQLAGAALFRGAMPVTATRASYSFSNRAAYANPALARTASRSFFSIQQRTLVQQRVQNSFTLRNSTPTAQRPSASGWTRFGDPGARLAPERQNFAGGREQSGWHRFGEPQGSAPAYGGQRLPQSSGRTGGPAVSSPGGASPYVNGFQSGSRGSYAGYPNVYGPVRPNNPPQQFNTPVAPHYSAPAGGQRFSAPPAAQHFSAPSMPRYSAPPAPHYSAPSGHYAAPSNGGGRSSPRGGGGGSHSQGGGGHRGR